MSSVLTRAENKTTWFEDIDQQLDALRLDCLECCEVDQPLPTDKNFNLAKEFVHKMRTLADFPELPPALVWIATDGHIGITWKTERLNLDVIIAEPVVAYTTVNKKRKTIKLHDLSLAMRALAA